MKWVYKILRTILVTLLILLFTVPAGLYVALSLPSVQQSIRAEVEKNLSYMLSVDVSIRDISITPFNRVTLYGVSVEDARGDTALEVSKLGAGISFWKLLYKNRVELSYAEIIGMRANIYRDSAGSELNIQPIIDALASKDKNKPPTPYDVRINNVVLRTSQIAYNVLSAPRDTSRIDPNHLFFRGINADISLPAISNDYYRANIRRLTLREASGLDVRTLSVSATVSDTAATLEGLTIALPGSRIAFGDINVNYPSLKEIGRSVCDLPLDVSLAAGSHLRLSDLAFAAPVLKNIDVTGRFALHIQGTVNDPVINRLEIDASPALRLSAQGRVSELTDRESMRFNLNDLKIEALASEWLPIAERLAPVSDTARKIAANAGTVEMIVSGAGSLRGGNLKAEITSASGGILVEGDYMRRSAGFGFAGSVAVDDFDGSQLFDGTGNALAAVGGIDAAVNGDVIIGGGRPECSVSLYVPRIEYRGITYDDGIVATASVEGQDINVYMKSDNPAIDVDLKALVTMGREKSLKLDIDAAGVDLDALTGNSRHGRISGHADADLSGTSPDDVIGRLTVTDLYYATSLPDSRPVDVKHIDIDVSRADSVTVVRLDSDVADGEIRGRYRTATLPAAVKSLLAEVLPGITGASAAENSGSASDDVNDIDFNLTLKTLDPLGTVVKLPVQVIYPVELTGRLDSPGRNADLYVSAPFLQQGNKLIENTTLSARLCGASADTSAATGFLSFNTLMPTKKGPMALALHSDAVNDRVDSRLDFRIHRDTEYSGEFNTSLQFTRQEHGPLRTDLYVNPSKLVFNDTVWNVDASRISIEGKDLAVDHFSVGRSGQHVKINGRSTESESDSIVVSLEDVDLDYVFETLDIPNVMFGGSVSGLLYAKQVLTPDPRAYTPSLAIRGLKYNHSLLGDARINALWNNPRKAVEFDVDIDQADGRRSVVNARIVPGADSLDLRFNTDRIPIGFIQPFMAAFATNVSGYATGQARLWGTFKLVDMVGRLYGEDVKITLGITNTTYTTSDTVLFTPGRITLKDFTVRDDFGHTARLDGWLAHKYFKSPSFSFAVTDARDMLMYDVRESKDRTYYGRLFGNGSVRVNGVPGTVDIGADVSTAPGSTFTFVLSDAMNAQAYNFITFRDRDQARKDSIASATAPPELVRQLKERMNASQDGEPSVYKMNFAIDVTPQALITLVMDPVGGDRIRAHGHGNIRMAYDSRQEDLRLNGTYTVERGTYNFTLQDIIIKEFNITDGSSIAFHGSPYAAQLDIKAAYQLNANLTELDESFAADKELNRTNVPVQAVLKVTGDMRQPEIGYDLNFPTLSQDVYRKVRSIVNTEEMMNRQIIYLLALNRFYTPDYMNATRGNELVSVASSTISSQLSSMLGQLSDNWVIAPNFRSDRGDFSDMEVDLALSSHLLNNRLLLNGNFGYRDKTLNNNSFVGDFDIEYLLNRQGTIRLKAYNRYNDQNYYVKSALTTQGVGIVFKRDFDSFFSFLKPFLRKKEEKSGTPDQSAEENSPDRSVPSDEGTDRSGMTE